MVKIRIRIMQRLSPLRDLSSMKTSSWEISSKSEVPVRSEPTIDTEGSEWYVGVLGPPYSPSDDPPMGAGLGFVESESSGVGGAKEPRSPFLVS